MFLSKKLHVTTQVSLLDFIELMGSINDHHWTPSQMNTTQTLTLYFV